MAYRIFSAALILAVIAGSVMSGSATICNQGKKQLETRDLSRYEKAGPYEAGALMENYEVTMQALRGFLWTHWSQKRLGYIIVVLSTKEGDTITSHYYIEPSNSNVWHVVVRKEKKLLDREYWARTKESRYYNEVDEIKFYFLERIRKLTPTKEETKIPDDAQQSPNMWLLRLKDSNKKLLVTL